MQLTKSLVLFALGASSVSAAATPKHRRHQQFHEKKAVGDMVTAVIDGKTVSWVNEYGGATATAQATGASPAVAAAETTPTAATASPVVAAEGASSSASSSGSSSGSSAGNSDSVSTYTPFCAASSKLKRATAEEIAYKGNVGSTWGCNMQLVDTSIASQYDYVLKFTGQHTTEQQCVCWNKIGPNGGINGWFGNAAVTFNLPVNAEQVVAVDADSQGGCSCGAGSVPKNSIGEWAGTWVEFDMANSQNSDYSGSDVSALVAQSEGSSVQGMQVCSGSQCSSLTANAQNVQSAYVSGMENDDGVGINLAPGNVVLNVVVDYQG